MSVWSQLDFFRTAFEDSSDPVVVLDVRGVVIYANSAARPWTPDSGRLDESSELGAAVLPVLEHGGVHRVEWGTKGHGGVRAWFLCSLMPIHAPAGPRGEAGQGEGDADGKLLGWLCLSTDVTEMKRNEERLRRSEQLMVDAQGVAHLGTWEWDVSEPHAHWSAELYAIYGLTPATYTPSYEAYLKMVHPDDRQRVIDATNRVFHEHVPYSHDERIFRPDGSMRHLHTWAYPIRDEQGRLQRLVGVCQDITDRAEAEEKVRRLNADLEQRVAERTRQLEISMRDLEAFNAMVSHDLRTPLSTLELATAALSRPELTPESLAKTRERIKRAVSQMKNLMDDLLAFARIDSVALKRAPVDVSAMVLEILAELRHTEPARVVEVDVDPQIVCFADPGLMRLALQNVVGNAWKYTMRASPARIEVRALATGDRRVLQVRDNGAGFDMKDAHRLFAPFQRLHHEREFTGTGIGLASVQRILERHGCRVWAEGEPGAGATFFLELPEATAAGVAAGEPAQGQPSVQTRPA